jgi:hypothetical protein
MSLLKSRLPSSPFYKHAQPSAPPTPRLSCGGWRVGELVLPKTPPVAVVARPWARLTEVPGQQGSGECCDVGIC